MSELALSIEPEFSSEGQLFLIVGNSGSGKDSLIGELNRDFSKELNLYFPKRWITRNHQDENEKYISTDICSFVEKIKNNDFFIWWEAYGYLYGIDKNIMLKLQSGKNVVINVSRTIVEEIKNIYPRTTVILIDVSIDIIKNRLGNRQRGNKNEILNRLSRADKLTGKYEYDFKIDNCGELFSAAETTADVINNVLNLYHDKFEISILGSSSANPEPNINNSSYLLKYLQDKYILIDAPPNLPSILKDKDIPLDNIEKIIITHNHLDHILGIAAILHCYRECEKELNLYAPAQSLLTIRGLIKELQINTNIKLKFTEIKMDNKYIIYDDGFINLTSTSVYHSRDTVAIKVHNKITNKKVIFSSDTTPCKNLIELADNGEILIHDCSGLDKHKSYYYRNHSSSLQAGEIAEKAGVKQLILTHLDRRYFNNENELIKEASSKFSGKVKMAQDGHVYYF
ncbi:MAG: MBL fold metallo-hydrolase [Halanaerobiaceae bacterium]